MTTQRKQVERRTTTGAARRGVRSAALAAAVAGVALVASPLARAGGTHGLGAGTEAVRAALEHHTLTTLDGQSLTLGSLDGEVVVVNFWATWCRPCRRELPELDALHAEIARRGGRVVAVSIDQEPRNVRRFCKAHALKLPVAHDGPEGLARELDLQHVPFTMILDRAGAVAFTTSRSEADALAEIGAVARRLLAQTPVLSGPTDGGIR